MSTIMLTMPRSADSIQKITAYVVGSIAAVLGGNVMLLGFADFWVWLAYVLSVASAVLCVIWGVAQWRTPEANADVSEATVREWADEEDKLEEEA